MLLTSLASLHKVDCCSAAQSTPNLSYGHLVMLVFIGLFWRCVELCVRQQLDLVQWCIKTDDVNAEGFMLSVSHFAH